MSQDRRTPTRTTRRIGKRGDTARAEGVGDCEEVEGLKRPAGKQKADTLRLRGVEDSKKLRGKCKRRDDRVCDTWQETGAGPKVSSDAGGNYWKRELGHKIPYSRQTAYPRWRR
jgi:hypothetical protein